MTYELKSLVYSPTFNKPNMEIWRVPFPEIGKLYRFFDCVFSLVGKFIFVTNVVEEGNRSSLWIEGLIDDEHRFFRWISISGGLYYHFRLIEVVDDPAAED